MSELVRYPVPWRAVLSLSRHIGRGTRRSVDEFSAAVTAGMCPPPLVEGMDKLPENPRFLLVANHYQRKGLWILYPASVITQAIRRRYGPGDPPVRWIATVNWPRWRLGPWSAPSPGDWLLPKVAHALSCYPVPFASTDPVRTMRSIRRILSEAPALARPIGLFPEGAGGTATSLSKPLPGAGRLIAHLARLALAVVPVGIAERKRLIVRFGDCIPPAGVPEGEGAAPFLMAKIRELTGV